MGQSSCQGMDSGQGTEGVDGVLKIETGHTGTEGMDRAQRVWTG